MKTFTNYAEKKAKQFLNLLQGYTKGIRITAILILLLMGVSNAWGDVKGGEIYFDAYTSNWTSNLSTVEYVISHDSYSKWYKMEMISNTQLYYISSASWNDAKYIAFTANFGWTSGEGNSYDHRKKYGQQGSWYTAKSTYEVNSGKTYLFYAASASNDAEIITSSPAGYLGDGKTYTALNYTQTVQQHLSTDGGNNYAASTEALATVKVSSYELNSKNTTTSSSGTFVSGNSSATCSAARTATVTYTVSDVKAGYTFVGWYDGTTEKSKSTTYSYNATEAKTITARFSKITVSATITPTVGTVGANNLTFSITSNVPTNSGYFVGVYNFGENDYAGGYINGDKLFTANPTEYTATYNQNTPGTYHTRAFVMKDAVLLATSEKIPFTVNAGGGGSTVSEWKMYSGDTELGTFTNEGNDTYTLTITIPAGGYAQTNYRNNLGNVGTPGAITLLNNEQTLVLNNGRIQWYDGAGRFKITIRKDGETWKISAIKLSDPEPTYLYLKPNSNWKNNARFAAYFFDNGEKWVDMTDVGCNGDYYRCERPVGYRKVIFVRMNPSTQDNNWNNKLHQTGDLTIPTDGKNLFTVPTESLNGATTTWSTYSTPEYEIALNQSTGGTINIAPQSPVEVNTEVTVTMTAADGYTFNSGTITIGKNTQQNITEIESRHTICGPTTITAQWTPNTYYVAFDNNTGTGEMERQTFTYATEQNLRANGFTKTGYTFTGWNTAADGSGTSYTDKQSVNNLTTVNGATITLYAQWTLSTYTITYKDKGGSNFSGTHADGHPTTHTYGTATQLKSATKTGYTFDGWFANQDCTGEPITSLGATDYSAAITLYAKWTEIKSTVTVRTDHPEYGKLKFDDASKEWGTTASVGVSTSQIITATANEGYKFVQWDLSGSAASDSPLTNATITLKSNGTDAEGTATAVFAEDLNSSWHLVGSENIFPAGWAVNGNSMMKKRSGSSSEKKVYMTITVSDINNINKPYEFKVVDDNGDGDDIWYGYSNDSYLTWTGTSEKTVYQSTKTENTKNLKFTPNAVGNYVFEVDYSGTNPKVTITYPELGGQSIYLYGEFNDWKANDQDKFEEENGLYILEREFTKRERFQALKTSQAEYEFKLNINGTNYTVEGNGNEKVLQYTRQNTTKVVNDGNSYQNPDYNLLLQADITGTYTFTYDPKTQKLTVTHPTYSPPASYIVGDFSDGEKDTDPMPKDGGAGKDWTETFGQELENGVGCINLGKNSTWHFKIKINGIWYGADIAPITTSGTYTLDNKYADTGEKNVTIITTNEDGCYYFEYTVNPDGTLSVLIIFPNDRRTVTFDMQGKGTPVDEQQVLYRQTAVQPYVSDVEGYLFAGWYTDAACSIGNEYDFNTPVTQNITLYAKWIPYGDCIFYKNNLNWDEVYVYFYSSDKYWNNDKGTGAYKDSKFPMSSDHRPYYREFRGKMTRIGLTDIWYFDYISAAKQIDPTYWAEIKGYKNIAFTAHEQHNHSFFDNTKVIRRGDFNQQLPLFIPQTDQTPTDLNKHNGFSAKYYNNGLWMKYNNTYSGYDWSGKTADTDWSNTQLTSDLAGRYSFTAEVKLNAGKTYEFKIKNLNNTWFGNTGTMTQDNCTNWWFTENTNNAKITPTINGTYIFTVYLGDGKVMVSLDYPLSVGDYRLAYKDNQPDSFHPGHYIKKRTNVEEKRDTVSFFIHKDNSPQILLQYCSAISNDGTPTWQTDETYTSLGNAVNSTTVYNFILKQTNINSTNTPSVETSETHLYTGDYYIRTDAAAGGWKSFRQEDNKMTYSSYADNNEDFDHYFCEWITANRNVKFTIANDYSYCISDTTDGDNIINKNDVSPGCLPADANVRFGWDSKTNQLRRAYIAGSGHKKDRFLVLEGDASLRDVNGNRFTGKTFAGQDRFNLTDDEVVFDDMGNWIYQIDVKANKDTKIDLTALYNGKVQYFKGGSEDKDDIPLIVTTNDNEKYYKIRIIYDFKTNHLISAWLPDDETITTNEQLGADMMIIRRNQEKAEQLKFNPLSSSLTEVGTAYAVITFDKYFLNNKNSETGNPLPQAEEKSANERKFYWISFPFDVKISDVFGFGEYGDYWIMEYYDGEARAKEGYWAETETFWKYITNKNYVLKAGQGYVLYLNLNKMGYTSPIFAHTDEVNLYFPSASPLNVITGELPTAVQVPAHECTIQRDKRNIYDSNWNLIGVPGFADIENVSIGGSDHQDYNDEIQADCVSFYYKYLPATNTYSATTQNETFQTMYAYMVQFAGTINWQVKTMPAPLAARRTGSTPSQYDLRLEIAQGEQTDQTFVQLKEEDATAEFDMNVDMTKIFNSGMNIYTLTGSNAIQVAGNALPIAKATIPVGVVTATAGEYTFRMPDGTDGIAVTLVDNVTGTHTNMLMNEYTVTLHAGTIENRFYLVVDPDRTATSVENVGSGANGDEAKGVEKFLIDGKLFIRTADGIFDAKGQRL